MARGIRIEYAGAFYHVMARRNRRERIFRDEADRRFFCATLGEAWARTGWRVHAWVLMSNHYHLMLETPEANLVEGMKWLQNTYPRRFNSQHRLWGRLFGDRYKAVLSEGKSYCYYCSLMGLHLSEPGAGWGWCGARKARVCATTVEQRGDGLCRTSSQFDGGRLAARVA